jgi:hypothetical protein
MTLGQVFKLLLAILECIFLICYSLIILRIRRAAHRSGISPNALLRILILLNLFIIIAGIIFFALP